MADWKQITARIRRARSGKDPAGQLTNLFSKTRDAMVAFELARYFESKGNTVDAGHWYLTAAERFRRSDWKTKAQENATRLGATEPAEIPAPAPRSAVAQEAPLETVELPESRPPDDSPHADSASGTVAQEEAAAETIQVASAADSNRHRRGRRGREHQRAARRSSSSPSSRERVSVQSPPRRSQEEEQPTSPAVARKTEAAPEAPSPAGLRSRFGDPGLSSRLTQLEMNFRRLLACPPCSLEDAERAPAGPGVWVLTDSDLSTYYYVEPCQTLRVAIPHLLRSNASRRGGESIKPRLAEHLGIPETRVAKYLSDHCVVRWLQMDEGASHFAHFLIAVLHPALNE
jgi:hypothetical protein